MYRHDSKAQDNGAWKPAIRHRKGVTKHKLLTDKIISSIDEGVLPVHAQMPTHRDLAHALGISLQTVNLSYKKAERRGYLRGEAGRGTFVRRRGYSLFLVQANELRRPSPT